MSEKLFGVHSGAYWKRVLARVPVATLIWFFALLIPYYGIVNSLMGDHSLHPSRFQLLVAGGWQCI